MVDIFEDPGSYTSPAFATLLVEYQNWEQSLQDAEVAYSAGGGAAQTRTLYQVGLCVVADFDLYFEALGIRVDGIETRLDDFLTQATAHVAEMVIQNAHLGDITTALNDINTTLIAFPGTPQP